MIAGTPDIDAVTDSIDEKTFSRWMAAERIGMLGHSERMLGFLCFMVANYLGLKFDNPDDLRALSMPWGEPDQPGVSAFSALKSEYERAVQ
tara:strand:+ start:1747 stop:2019 length:273 start_codon:yes stop_codon:yes gene_type:complete